MVSPFNILVAGVGGQGNIVCGRVLAEAAVAIGRRPVIGETFGASRRGGSVFTHFRAAETDVGPLIPGRGAHLILGLEPLEALRAATDYGNASTLIIVSALPVQTVLTVAAADRYPHIDDMMDSMKRICGRVIILDPGGALEGAGTHRVLNVFMLGALAGVGHGPLTESSIRRGIERTVGLGRANLIAYEAGLKSVRESDRPD